MAFIIFTTLILLVLAYIEWHRMECKISWVAKFRRVVHPLGDCCCWTCIGDEFDIGDLEEDEVAGEKKGTHLGEREEFGKLFKDPGVGEDGKVMDVSRDEDKDEDEMNAETEKLWERYEGFELK